jgi:hypothetical protein
MSDYQLERLGTREFEHVTRALATAVFGAGVRPQEPKDPLMGSVLAPPGSWLGQLVGTQ